jgi:hypothetical protein
MQDQMVVSVGPYMFQTLPCALHEGVDQIARDGLAADEHGEPRDRPSSPASSRSGTWKAWPASW